MRNKDEGPGEETLPSGVMERDHGCLGSTSPLTSFSSPPPTPTLASGSLPVFLELSLHEVLALACGGWTRGWRNRTARSKVLGDPGILEPQLAHPFPGSLGPRHCSHLDCPLGRQLGQRAGVRPLEGWKVSKERPYARVLGAFRSSSTSAPRGGCAIPTPTCSFPPTSPPPALTLPGGRGGEERPQAAKGEGDRGVGCFPVLWGLSLFLLENPQFLKWGSPEVRGTSTPLPVITPFSQAPQPGSLQHFRCHWREKKDGGGRNGGNSLPQHPTISGVGGSLCPSVALHSAPLLLVSP